MDNMPEKRRKLAQDVGSLDDTPVELKKKVSELENSLRYAKSEAEETIDELKIKVSGLEDSLSHAKRKADDYRFQLNISLRKHREAADELEAVEKAFLEGLETYADPHGDAGIVAPKEMGYFYPEEQWGCNLQALLEDKDSTLKWKSVDDFMTFWEARVREPDFHASALKDDGNGNMKYVIKEHHEELNEVRKSCGDAVYEAVCNAHLEVMEWGTGSVLWHYIEKRKATVSDVLNNCDIEMQPRW